MPNGEVFAVAFNIVPITLFALAAVLGSALQRLPFGGRPSKGLAWSSFVVAFVQLGVAALLPPDTTAAIILTSAQLVIGVAFGAVWFRYLRK
jgi:hypothetical protein